MDVRISSSYRMSSQSASAVMGPLVARADSASGSEKTTQLPVLQNKNTKGPSSAPSRLVYETQEMEASQIRRMSLFEQKDGRQFSRMETLTLTAQGARREVVQQNPSGSVTRYEDILDQDSSGSLRRTQRFYDESGEAQTTISDPSALSVFPWTLESAAAAFSFSSASASGATTTARGTYYDAQV